jgi:hypothetical protein
MCINGRLVQINSVVNYCLHQVAQVSSDHKCLQLLGTSLAALKVQMEEDVKLFFILTNFVLMLLSSTL